MTDATDPDLLTPPMDEQTAEPPADATLQLDVAMVLVECHRDRRGDGVFRPDVSARRLEEFAALVARRLAPRIGGRYVPKRLAGPSQLELMRAERDAKIVQEFNGRNTHHLMAKFGVSRRWIYHILAKHRMRQRIGLPPQDAA